MKKWHNLTAKFTDEEYQLIQKFMKKNKMKQNKLVRRAIEDLVGVTLADAKRKKNQSLPPDYLAVYEFYQSLKKELKPYPKISKKLDQFFKIWKTKFFSKWTIKYNKMVFSAGKKYDKFRIHKSPGRPKAKKKKRGKPKDTGYND